VDGVSVRLRLAEGLLRKGWSGGLRKEPSRHWPLVRCIRGQRLSTAESQSQLLGRKAPTFDTVVFKFVPDATTRVAEIECGSSDVTLDIPYEEYDRRSRKRGLKASPRRPPMLVSISRGCEISFRPPHLGGCRSSIGILG
jgi:hypothetical protein